MKHNKIWCITQPWYHPHLREGLSASASAGCNPISGLQGQFSPLSALSALIHKKTKSPISTHAYLFPFQGRMPSHGFTNWICSGFQLRFLHHHKKINSILVCKHIRGLLSTYFPLIMTSRDSHVPTFLSKLSLTCATQLCIFPAACHVFYPIVGGLICVNLPEGHG